MAVTSKKKRTRSRKPPSEDPGNAKVQGQVRFSNEWTPARIRSIERTAETGNLSQAVSLADWVRRDDRVRGALSARIDALMGLVPTFEPADGDKRRNGRLVKDLEKDWWTAYPVGTTRKLLEWGIMLGCGLARQPWPAVPGHGNRWLACPEFWFPQSLRFDFKTSQWSVEDALRVRHVVTPGDGEWILHTPYGPERPWAEGLWSSLAPWVLAKHYARIDWWRHGERGVVTVATSDKTGTDPQRADLVALLNASGANVNVALPAGWDLKVLEVAAATERIYRAQIELADTAIAILIRGGNLSTNVEGGSFAAAESQAKTGDEAKLRFDAETWTATVRDQSLRSWAFYNYGEPELAPWPKYPVEPEEDKKKRADTLVVVAQAVEKFEARGFEVDDRELIDRFSLTFLKPRQPGNKPKVPGQEPDPGEDGDGDQGGEGGDDEGTEDGEDGDVSESNGNGNGDANAAAPGGFLPRLASGAPVAENPGFVSGQVYVDGVAESALARTKDLLQTDLQAVAKAIESATSYDDLRTRLRELYAEMSPDEINDLMFRAMALGELAGRRSVTQDA